MISVFRKEIKYLIYQHEFARMRPQLTALLQRDTHGDDFGYVVRSLYFDSVYDRDYYDNVDGLLKKAKIRLRIYGHGGPIKLELKQKEGSDGQKQSLILDQEEARRMVRCEYSFLSYRPEEAARTIYMRLMQGAYRPKTLVEYHREAYTFPAGDVRVTFDTEVCGTASGHDLFEEKPAWVPLIPKGTGVLEVKYTSFLPSLIKDIVKTDRLAVANSKYAQARELCGIGGDIRK